MKPKFHTARLLKSIISGASLVTAITFCFGSSAFAADRFWNSGAVGSFTDTANWSTGVVPTSTDFAMLQQGGTASFTTGAYTVGDLRVGRNGPATMAVSGGVFSVSVSTHVGRNVTGVADFGGGNGILTVSGAGTIFNAGTSMNVGLGNNGGTPTGVVTVSGGATLNLSGLMILGDGFNAGTYSGTLNVNNGTVTTGGGELWVGQKGSAAVSTGTGVVNLTAGSVTTGSWTTFGRFGGNGTMTMTGGTFTKNGAASNFILADGSGSVGLVDQSSGNGTVLINSGELWIGQDNGVGTYNVGGTSSVVVNNYIAIGRANGTGTLNMTGGAIIKTGVGNLEIGSLGTNPHTGTLNLSGGLIDVQTGNVVMGVEVAVGTLNLNGGTLKTSQIAGAAGTANINFNGGTLMATANQAAFLTNLDTLVVQSGGAKIDSNGFNIGTVQILTGTGGLTKSGAGTLTLTGASTYSGATVVNGGKLAVTSANTGAGSYSVADGKTLSVTPVVLDGQLGMSSLTLGSSTGATLDIDLGNNGNPSLAPIHVTGAVNFNGITTINIATSTPGVGQFPLIKYDSKVGGTILADFALTYPAGLDAELVINIANNSIDLNIIQIAAPRWDATISDVWDTSTQNWVSLVDFSPAIYGDGQPVVFDDFVGGITQGAVTLPGTVTPASVTFDNPESVPYSLTGAGKISGTTGLLKKNDGPLTLGTASNDYTGVTRLEGGTTSVALLANGGVASNIGKSTAAPANLVLAGGALSYTGPSVTIDRGYSVAAGGSTLAVSEAGTNLTLSGPAQATVGGLVRTGPGTVTYTNATNQLTAGGGLAGVFEVRGGTTVFNVPFQTNDFNGEVWIGQGTGNTGRVDVLNGAQFNSNTWIVIGREGGNGRLDVANSTLNHTTGEDLMVGSDADSVGEMNVSGSAVINNDWGWFPIGINGGTGTYNQTGGSYTNAQSGSRLRVGIGGGSTGNFNLSGGTFSVGDRPYVGVDGGVGIANISGGAFTSGGDPHIGVENGNGTLALSNAGSLITGGWSFIGGNLDGPADPQSSVGLVTMADTSSWTMGGRLTVGRRTGNTGTLTMTGGTLTKNGTESFFVGDVGGTGEVNQSAGTVNVGIAELWIGNAGGTGIYNLSGTGVVNVTNNYIAIGRDNGSGTLNVTGGTITKAGVGNLTIGGLGATPHAGTLNLSGGLIDVQGGIVVMGVDVAVGTLNLNGGTLKTSQIAGAAGTANINFNGGTLLATTDQAAFLTNLDTLDVQSGGAKIDSNGFNIGTAQNLTGVGGLTKKGTGTLTLSGANTYGGNTTVEDGTLSITAPDLVDTSTLTIGTAAASPAVLNLPNPGTDVVAALIIDGGSPAADGKWGRIGSIATLGANFETDAITGDGLIEVGTTSPYATWINTYFPGETNPLIIGPAADPDGDGQTNALEFALGGVPNSGSNNAKIYSLVADSDDVGTDKELLMTIAVRSGSSAFSGSPSPSSTMDGFTCTVEGSLTLSSFPAAVTPVGTVAPPAPNATAPAGYEYRTFSLNGSNGLPTKGFLRVKVAE